MPQLHLREMMITDVKTLAEDDSISTADWLMTVAEVRHVVVVDGARRVVGIVSDRDVLRAVHDQPRSQLPVRAVMSRHVRTAHPGTPAVVAAAALLDARCGALPVVDEDQRLVGIVTTTDFVELARRALAGHPIDQPHARA